MALSYESVETYVRRRLGEPVIEVELTSEQIKEVIDQTLAIYTNAKPFWKLGFINGLPSTQRYTLTAAQVGRGIVDLMQPDMLRQPVSLDQFDVFKYHTFLPNLDPGDFYAERVWWNEVRRSAGSDEDWYVEDHEDGSADIYISPMPSEAKKFSYVYLVNVPLERVPPVDQETVKNYVLALCKQVLGGIRRKFTSAPGGENSIEMDGATLVEEGKAEQEKFDDYFAHLGDRVPPIRG